LAPGPRPRGQNRHRCAISTAQWPRIAVGRGWLGLAGRRDLRASLQIPDRAGAPRRPATKARRKCLYLLVPVLRRNAGSGDGSVMPATWSGFVGKLLRQAASRIAVGHRQAFRSVAARMPEAGGWRPEAEGPRGCCLQPPASRRKLPTGPDAWPRPDLWPSGGEGARGRCTARRRPHLPGPVHGTAVDQPSRACRSAPPLPTAWARQTHRPPAPAPPETCPWHGSRPAFPGLPAHAPPLPTAWARQTHRPPASAPPDDFELSVPGQTGAGRLASTPFTTAGAADQGSGASRSCRYGRPRCRNAPGRRCGAAERPGGGPRRAVARLRRRRAENDRTIRA